MPPLKQALNASSHPLDGHSYSVLPKRSRNVLSGNVSRHSRPPLAVAGACFVGRRVLAVTLGDIADKGIGADTDTVVGSPSKIRAFRSQFRFRKMRAGQDRVPISPIFCGLARTLLSSGADFEVVAEILQSKSASWCQYLGHTQCLRG